jgi:hypothetical protein
MLRISLEDTRVDDRPAHPRLTPNVQRGEICKAHGLLRVMIAEAKTMGGVHVYRTTSSNSIRQLMASMAHIQELTGGSLSYVPLELSVEPKKVKPEGSRGYQTVYVVSLTYRAAPLEFLKDVASQAQLRATMRQRIAAHEIAALPAPGHEDLDEQRAVAEEYVGTDADADADVIDVEGQVVDKNAKGARQQGQEPPKQEDPGPEPPKQKASQEPPQEPQGKKAASTEQREALRKAKEEAEAAKEEPPPPQDEEPPPPTDDDDPATPPSDSAHPQDEVEQERDAKGFPVFATTMPDGADQSAASKDLRKAFIAAGHQAGFTDLELREWIKELWDVESTAKLQAWQVTAMTDPLSRMKRRSS